MLTGHLGSGKTTLLNKFLSTVEKGTTAVIVNEFGEIAIDNELIRQSEENVVLLENGCICCTVRGDLIRTLLDLNAQVRNGDLPDFARIVIETTGLADPVPIIHSMMNNLEVMLSSELVSIVATVDAVLGKSTLDSNEIAARQAAIADRILITKSDLVTDDALDDLSSYLRWINPSASIDRISLDDTDFDRLDTPLFAPSKPEDVRQWLQNEDRTGGLVKGHDTNALTSFCVSRDEPLDWDDISEWIETLTQKFGPKLHRIKGFLNMTDSPDRPYVIHGIQHLFHPPQQLDAWPSEDRRSRVVFITDGVCKSDVDDLLVTTSPALERAG
ncbi:GTP-binding protein [Marivita sp. S6314]|nr:GTP-binding protein [Marivita sp. S6314]MCK0150838.1 GTP-binding protein [Marivita sp. S6314]